MWVDTNGGSCTRQASAGAYVDAQACSSLGAAYGLAKAGDTILVKGGSYSGQTIRTGVLGAPVVTIAAAPSETVTVGGYSILGTGNIVLDGINFVNGTQYWTSLDVEGGGNTITNILIENAKVNGSDINRVNFLTFSHTELGPYVACQQGGNHEDAITISDPDYTRTHDITFDHMYMHDISQGSAGGACGHTDGIQSFNYHNLAIKNSIIANVWTLLTAYAFNSSYDADPNAVSGLTIENNLFLGGPNTGKGGYGLSFGNHSAVPCGAAGNHGNQIRNNVWDGGAYFNGNCQGSSDADVTGNVNIPQGCSSSGSEGSGGQFNYQYNVDCSNTGTNKACAPKWADPTHANFNYKLDSTDTCAKNTIPPSASFAPLDYFGSARPQCTNADAGYHELTVAEKC